MKNFKKELIHTLKTFQCFNRK